MAANSGGAALGSFEASDADLKRNIGLWGLISIAVSIQVGSSWLLATLAAASMAGPASIVSWIAASVFFGVIAVNWMELGTMLPRSGAAVRYPRLTHGPFLSWFNGWGYLIAMIALPVIEVQAVLTYVGGHWSGLGLVAEKAGVTMLTWPVGILTGVVLLFGFFLLNVFGVKLLSESNKYITIWKIVVPLVTAVLMLLTFKSSNFTMAGGFAPQGYGAILGAISTGGIVFAYTGVRQILDFGGEARNPRRDIPIALVVGGLLIPTVMYVSLQVGLLGALDWSDAGLAPGDWNGLLTSSWAASPLLNAVAAAGFAWFTTLLITDAALSPAATGWVFTGGAARIAYSVSVNGELPTWLRRMNRFGVPWIALVGTSSVGLLFLLPVPSWYQFVGMVSTALVLGYLMAGPVTMVLRRVAPELPRPVRIKWVRTWSIAGYVASMLLIYFAGWITLVNVMTLVFLALPIYGGYTSVQNGWTPSTTGRVLAVAFTTGWLSVAVGGGWLLTPDMKQTPGGWSFPVYFGAMVTCIAAYLAVLWAISTATGRRHLASGLWIVPSLLAVMLLAYLGPYGPHAEPRLGHGIDVALIALVAIGSYLWAVRSGTRTDELQQIIDATTSLQDRVRQGAPHTATIQGTPAL
ncbi:APC family permease [Streptomyces sp. LHD-70]|uniref:APC family permease n=1 Tax=Streptomyces sp. LHD-70 TaxID=3072140 RepID=UPI00280F30A4|nr:APC family permease [Streptomyces sp. LHD-70]MDQ8708104.1 APC family permease [Streptomyces sp. LHD-70]